ncbi:MAG TPA: glutathione S-transferase family protein [Azospirillaceae bacterium]|nr:glutathione S-transferase family protein [Azospirillaceae bacterium]
MSDLTLVMGNKAYSSWSLRPWLALKQTGQRFEEVVIPLRQPETKASILRHSPGGKVPVLHHGDTTVWESIAICEYIAETFPQAHLWPAAAPARAVARSVAAEMHAGFADLRRNLPMDLKEKRSDASRTPECEADIARITQIWRDARGRFGIDGPFLFSRFSIADALFAPVVTRFDTYGVPLDPVCRAYAEAVLDLPAMREWHAAAKAEPWTINF